MSQKILRGLWSYFMSMGEVLYDCRLKKANLPPLSGKFNAFVVVGITLGVG